MWATLVTKLPVPQNSWGSYLLPWQLVRDVEVWTLAWCSSTSSSFFFFFSLTNLDSFLFIFVLLTWQSVLQSQAIKSTRDTVNSSWASSTAFKLKLFFFILQSRWNHHKPRLISYSRFLTSFHEHDSKPITLSKRAHQGEPHHTLFTFISNNISYIDSSLMVLHISFKTQAQINLNFIHLNSNSNMFFFSFIVFQAKWPLDCSHLYPSTSRSHRRFVFRLSSSHGHRTLAIHIPCLCEWLHYRTSFFLIEIFFCFKLYRPNHWFLILLFQTKTSFRLFWWSFYSSS